MFELTSKEDHTLQPTPTGRPHWEGRETIGAPLQSARAATRSSALSHWRTDSEFANFQVNLGHEGSESKQMPNLQRNSY